MCQTSAAFKKKVTEYGKIYENNVFLQCLA